MSIPVYKFDPAQAFTEVPPYKDAKGNAQSQTTLGATNPVAAITLAMAYLLKGCSFPGIMADLSMESIHAEVSGFCREKQISVERMFDWAQSIALPIEETLTQSEIDQYVPKAMKGVGFKLDQYQIDIAAWNARRMGSIQALGCGVGKSSTATAAAITAARIGRCSSERCYIECPLNAVPQWQPYLIDLRETFKTVDVVTVDSLHHIEGLEREPGGALIVDEAHKLKSFGADRTALAHAIRPAFEWAVCLTGTLLHTGPEGVISVQDLACPGLARFIDKMAFGEAFNCIITKRFRTARGFIKRRSLGKPDKKNIEVFERYLSRSTRSLRFESEEVKKVFVIPENTRTTVSEFEPSPWVQTFKFTSPLPEDSRGKVSYDSVVNARVEYLNPADTNIEVMAPAIAAALFIENRKAHEVFLAGLTEEEKQFMPKEQLAPPGLPSFPMVMHNIMRIGWEDLLLKYCTYFVDEDKKIEMRGYEFVRPFLYPSPGPKILWLQDWLLRRMEEGEQVVVGAVAVETVNMIQAILVRNGITYRMIRGGVNQNDRTEYVKDFQAGKFQVMLLQQVAGSESVTLTGGRYSVLVDHDFSPIPYTQFIHRTYRRGQLRETEHTDLAFNDMQLMLLGRLKGGEAFDAQVREKIEKMIEFQRSISSYALRI